MIFKGDFPPGLLVILKDQHVLVLSFSSMQDATEKCHYPELVGAPVRLRLTFVCFWDTSLNSLYWEIECLRCSWQVRCCWKKLTMVNVALQQKSIVSLCWCSSRLVHSFRLGSNFFLWNFCHQKNVSEQNVGWALDNDCKLLSQIVFFADSLGREKYSLFKHYFKQMMPEALQSHPSVCSFYRIHASCGFFHIPRRINNGVHIVIVLPFIGIYRYFFST